MVCVALGAAGEGEHPYQSHVLSLGTSVTKSLLPPSSVCTFFQETQCSDGSLEDGRPKLFKEHSKQQKNRVQTIRESHKHEVW